MAKKKPPPPEEPKQDGAPGWMVTFSDVMTLLLCFFVVLFSMSEIKQDKFKAVAIAIREFFDYKTGAPKQLEVTEKKDAFKESYLEFLRKIKAKEQGNSKGRKGLKGKNVKVRKVREGLKFTQGAKALFDIGSARLNTDDPEVVAVLTELAKELHGLRYKISIKGSASFQEKGRIVESGVSDLMDLSLRRAKNVRNYLIYEVDENLRIPAERIEVSGRGAYAYNLGGDSPEEQAKARSVEVTTTEERVYTSGERYKIQ